LKIAICDDNNIIAESIQEALEKVLQTLALTEYSIETYANGVDFVHHNVAYDLVILDVEMPELDGFELAEKIHQVDDHTLIIFLTSHAELMSRGYHVHAFRYLTKPIDDSDFREAITSAVNRISSYEQIVIKYERIDIVINTRTITHIESLGDGSCIYTSGQHYITNYSMKSLRERLPKQDFILVHRRYLVNLKYVKEVHNAKIILSTDMQINISMKRKKEIKAAFYEYAFRIARM
jgi:DNA-binding LytR/AlgR family response regulator